MRIVHGMPPRRASVIPEELDKEDPDEIVIRMLCRRKWLFAPWDSKHAQHRRHFRIMLLAMMVYENVYIPFQAAFRVPTGLGGRLEIPVVQLFLQYGIDACFWLDMIITFNTILVSPPEEGSQYITSRLAIASR